MQLNFFGADRAVTGSCHGLSAVTAFWSTAASSKAATRSTTVYFRLQQIRSMT